MQRDDEPMGGDPPCWAHLFDPDDGGPPVADLPALARGAAVPGPAWTLATDDFHANLMVFDDGDGIDDARQPGF